METAIASLLLAKQKHHLGECNIFLGRLEVADSGNPAHGPFVSTFLAARGEFPASRGVLIPYPF